MVKMNTNDIYIPIDIAGPIKTSSGINIQKHSANNPVLLFQLFDKGRPMMLDDVSKVSIAFTNTNNESVAGSGNLQIVNPHRGTISYEISSDDITLFGLNTITIGVTTGSSFFTVQCVAMCQDIDDSLFDALQNSGEGSSSSSSSATSCGCSEECWCCPFPCSYYNEWCRMCRRCKFAWFNNSYPKPVSFDTIKMCKNPYISDPVPNFALTEGYEKAYLATVSNADGSVGVVVGDTTYICDVGTDGAVYLMDKTMVTPSELIGLYLGQDLVTYYKTSEKSDGSGTFDIKSLFN